MKSGFLAKFGFGVACAVFEQEVEAFGPMGCPILLVARLFLKRE